MFNAKRFQLTSAERGNAERAAQASANAAQRAYDIFMTTSGVVRVEPHNPHLVPSALIRTVEPCRAP